ncbi:hypothetical protein ACQEVZ_60645 [Dactylosporangium sp. CA-152071]|uniref:hypothetical protein n=1 Tax=Dactylosporangium sp. CA-152071 TaxID=3239933 RepID=UPI003D8C5A0C
MRGLFELNGAGDPDGVVWSVGSRADHLAGTARLRLFRTDRGSRLRAMFGLQYVDLAQDCRYAWQFTGRPWFLLGLAASLANVLVTFLTAAAIVVALGLAWLGQPVRLWIAAGMALAFVSTVSAAIAELFAPQPADVGAGPLTDPR